MTGSMHVDSHRPTAGQPLQHQVKRAAGANLNDTDSCTIDPNSEQRMSSVNLALGVLSAQRTALSYLDSYYKSHFAARQSLFRTTTAICDTLSSNGKLVITGVGKSGLICRKLVATFNSVRVQSCFLHPTEALHGDLGTVQPRDAVLMLTASGNTPELLSLLQFLPQQVPLIILTSCRSKAKCKLKALRPDAIFLPAPVHEPEEMSVGIPAPTTTAVNAHALGNSIALAVGVHLSHSQGDNLVEKFHESHPGGCIGMKRRNSSIFQTRSHL